MPSVPPLWEGYDDKSEDDLLSLLEAKVDATLDPDDPTDERATRDFAQAVASHEWLKRRGRRRLPPRRRLRLRAAHRHDAGSRFLAAALSGA